MDNTIQPWSGKVYKAMDRLIEKLKALIKEQEELEQSNDHEDTLV